MHKTHRGSRHLVGLGIALILGTVVSLAAEAGAAMFLEVPGIPGGSTSPLGTGEIEVLSYQLSVTPQVSAKPPKTSQACGGTVSKPPASKVTITKYIDVASPQLFAATAQGTSFPTVTLHVFKGTSQTEYLTLTLSNAVITSDVHGGTDGGDVPTEALGFSAAAVQTAYVNPDNTASGSTAGWNACTRPGLPTPRPQ